MVARTTGDHFSFARLKDQDMTEIYVSTDIEADGPVPGLYSMLSFASAAFDAGGKLLDTFSANLTTLPDATQHPDTMRWWQTQPAAWAVSREDLQQPEAAIKSYVAWLKQLPGGPVFVAYPVVFDFMFVQWYLHRFANESPFSFVALDIKTYAMAMLKIDFGNVIKSNMPRRWFDDSLPHTHKALDDAIEQGALFCKMLKENLKKE
jgi:DNA polymerase III alpha subunit (gram-positive type)